MQAAGLVVRTVIEGFPPSTSYRLTPDGEALLPALARLP
jgi:DNA-binding HxlR family transcriptional regulator